tara:strand:- start:215 stop:826 length:612 start_codon:yes stop_codon:yes gene_type:complete
VTRKKKLLITQITLLLLVILIISYTYLLYVKKTSGTNLIDKDTKEKIETQLSNKTSTQEGDIFYNIEYSGLDLAGNRYILKSEEAYNEKENQEIVRMKFVEAVFYFKDNTVLNLKSLNGVYNSKTLDMIFDTNIKALYNDSRLFAEKAEFNNSNNFLLISNNVTIEDPKGKIFADKLYFDIEKKELNISSFNNNKINANINLK